MRISVAILKDEKSDILKFKLEIRSFQILVIKNRLNLAIQVDEYKQFDSPETTSLERDGQAYFWTRIVERGNGEFVDDSDGKVLNLSISVWPGPLLDESTEQPVCLFARGGAR